MKNIRIFYLEIFPFLAVKFSIYLNRRVFVMSSKKRITWLSHQSTLSDFDGIRLEKKISWSAQVHCSLSNSAISVSSLKLVLR